MVLPIMEVTVVIVNLTQQNTTAQLRKNVKTRLPSSENEAEQTYRDGKMCQFAEPHVSGGV